MLIKKIQYLIFCSLIMVIALSNMYALDPEMIGFSNIANGESKSGDFEIKGVILNNGQVSRAAVKINTGSWENATGIERWSYTVHTDSYYGEMSVTVGAFDASGNQIAGKNLSITVIPGKPGSDIISGVYS